ncbi:hypothetical protein SELMODRAFT_446035 [Selaginella moellendorffii]|uniref:Uncharacterized protein n=1 Tax=Selaginella moellendorffii TaxID=88036 RepID=D8SN61_SELML|nr:uncharacterized protein LOC9648581 [Selaginella moellendorffii]EFJ14009.1 hypothetical protein SELMODRAFT_446035 [Selaginella moellendorffii]|eukprot:XP_002984759.1 uncharacterized protein LOC9648581 [Selaginella moellendorffii]
MLITGRYPSYWKENGAQARVVLEGKPRASRLSDPLAPPRKILSFLATCAPGLEAVVAAELQAPAIRAANVAIAESGGAVFFSGTWIVAFNAILWLRCGSRVMHLIASANLPWADAIGIDPVYQFVRYAVHWKRFLASNDDGHKRFRSFSVECRVRDCTRRSVSLYAPRKANAAINDALDLEFNPDVLEPHLKEPAEVPLFLLIHKDKARLYRDMSSDLGERSYKEVLDKTSLPGEIAAGVLTLAGWNYAVPGFGEINRNAPTVLLDPMCGCGTLLVEAALMSSNTAPGLLCKSWPFTDWHDFDEELWQECRARASAAMLAVPSSHKFLGNDRDQKVISACARAAERAGVAHLLQLSSQDFVQYEPPTRPSLVVVNPPWESKERTTTLVPTFSELGRFLRRHCRETDAYVLSGSRLLASNMRLKADVNWPIKIQGLHFRLCHYYILPKKRKDQAAPQGT